MVAVFLLLERVDLTYSNKPRFCCEGVQKIVQVERLKTDFWGLHPLKKIAPPDPLPTNTHETFTAYVFEGFRVIEWFVFVG